MITVFLIYLCTTKVAIFKINHRDLKIFQRFPILELEEIYWICNDWGNCLRAEGNCLACLMTKEWGALVEIGTRGRNGEKEDVGSERESETLSVEEKGIPLINKDGDSTGNIWIPIGEGHSHVGNENQLIKMKIIIPKTKMWILSCPTKRER